MLVAIYMQPVQDVIVGLPCMCRDLAPRIHACVGASIKKANTKFVLEYDKGVGKYIYVAGDISKRYHLQFGIRLP